MATRDPPATQDVPFVNKEVVKRHYSALCKTIAPFPDLLLSLSIQFYQYEFIDLHAKSSINKSGGLTGASMLLDHVMMKIEQSDQYIPLVMDILREEVALKDIVEKMENDSNKMNSSPSKIDQDMILTTPTPSSLNSFNDDNFPSVADTISSAERLKGLFESLCFLTMMVLSHASVDILMRLKLNISLTLQYARVNTPELQGYIMELEQYPNGQTFVTFLISKYLLGYLNFDLLNSIKPILSSDEFNDKLQDYKLAHEQFIKNHFHNIVEVFQQKPKLRPASVIGLPEIKVRLKNEWKGRSLYDWNEIMNDIIQWGQYIMIVDVEMNCVTITYQILPFILPRVITDLTNDTIKKRFTSIEATFIIPEEIHAQAMADHKWIIDTIQEQQVMKKTRPNERGEDPVIRGPDHTITDQPLEELPPKEGGYDDEIFLTTPPNDLQCPVCHLTLREPHQLSCCGSTLCQQQSMATSMETDQYDVFTPHSVFTESLAELNILLSGVCTELASQLWAKDLITDDLNDKIIDKSGVATTNHDLVRLMLLNVYKHLKDKNPKESREDKWKGFIKAMETEEIWKNNMVPKLKEDVEKAKINKVERPEAQVLKQNMPAIANMVTGGFINFGNYLEQFGVLTLDEKQKCTDPNNKHELIYTQKMLDEVGLALKKDEKVLDTLFAIMNNIGGPVKLQANLMKEQLTPNVN